MIKSSGEPLSEDVTLKAREYQQRSMILRGRQIIWMMIDYFKTNRSLQEQYTWQDIETSSMARRRQVTVVSFTLEAHYHQSFCDDT